MTLEDSGEEISKVQWIRVPLPDKYSTEYVLLKEIIEKLNVLIDKVDDCIPPEVKQIRFEQEYRMRKAKLEVQEKGEEE